ncbi:hypothetical protein ACFU6S_31530 [Streptomyces sp. NPDC057456]|uniref:hypothetical protein n=1 Tax=Streptomyces sp. NPDC057456 TaxID=3346139 RepID=UPI0036C702D7
MPRGRHRHSPPLHRLLPPSAIAGVSLVCALGPWVFTEPMALRGLAAAAAATAILGAYVMRRWDMQAGKQVADLERARVSDEWRYEERVAELESDLDESRELRVKLEQRLRSKRTELAGLRNEHAALLRRYATAETERASALEGRRLLEIEAAPTPALPAARASQDAEPTGAVVALEAEDADDTDGVEDIEDTEGTDAVEAAAEAQETAEEAAFDDTADSDDSADSARSGDAVEPVSETEKAAGVERAEGEPEASAVFSPEGSKLFLRAQAALARFDTDGVKASKIEDHAEEETARATSADVGATPAGGDAEAAQEDEARGKPEAVDEHTRATAPHTAAETDTVPQDKSPEDKSPEDKSPEDRSPRIQAPDGRSPRSEAPDGRTHAAADATDVDDAADAEGNAPEPAASEAAAVGEHVTGTATVRPAPRVYSAPVAAPAPAPAPAPAAAAGALVPRPAGAVQRRPSGHFAVPTAVAVVPAAQPVRRPTAEGGFDFFGTKSASTPLALEAVQNEDLADVVGQEALALHKAESEAEFKPLDEAARGVGQVIDLTAHDETEHIDLQGLRSAVS